MGVIGRKKYVFQLIYGKVVHGSPKASWILHSLTIIPCPWYFMCKCTSLYVDFMVVISFLLLLVICWL